MTPPVTRPAEFLFVGLMFPKLEQPQISRPYNAATPVPRSVVGIMLSNNFAGAITKDLTVNSADDFALAVSDVVVIHNGFKNRHDVSGVSIRW